MNNISKLFLDHNLLLQQYGMDLSEDLFFRKLLIKELEEEKARLEKLLEEEFDRDPEKAAAVKSELDEITSELKKSEEAQEILTLGMP